MADLHVHIGLAGGRPVKITASRRLTVAEVLRESACRKGLDVVGIVDTHSPPVLDELRELAGRGDLSELPGGGLWWAPTGGAEERGPAEGNGILLIPASEVEVDEPGIGLVHYLCYLSDLATAAAFSGWLAGRVTNVTLSSQKARCSGEELARWVGAAGGFVIPAHVFTPYKGFFGQGGADLGQVLSDRALAAVPGVELGLSADTALAGRVTALAAFTFLSNSDAHSPETIAREHNALDLGGRLDFTGLADAIRAGRVTANFGLDPRLGKYHRTFCPACGLVPGLEQGTVGLGQACPACGRPGLVGGVYDRVEQLAAAAGPATSGPGPSSAREEPARRPPYVHQIPLRYVPGVGRAIQDRLLAAFGSETDVLHRVSEAKLAEVAGAAVARRIVSARGGTGLLDIDPGAGGRYGRLGHIKQGPGE